MNGLDGKVALVAGGATGIGRTTSQRLAAEGMRVVVGDINAEGAKETVQRITDAGGAATPVEFDIVDDDSVRALVAATVDAYGRIDALFNVAADLREQTIRADTNVVDIDLEVWDRTLLVNLRGFVLTLRHAIPEMLATGGGAIVNTASAAAYVGEAERPAYAAAKAGVTALTRHVASRWGKEGIRCNCVAPGLVITDAVRSGPHFEQLATMVLKGLRSDRLGEPEDIAAMVAYLFSDDAGWINGQVYSVDGGSTLR